MNTSWIRLVLLSVFVASVAVVGASAQYWDLELTLTSSTNAEWVVGSDEVNLDQEARALLSASALVGEQSRFVARGSYTYTLDRLYLFDLERLFFETVLSEPFGSSGALTVRIGRTATGEPTGAVVSHPIDGVRVGGAIGNTRLRFDAGYTGLLLAPVSKVNFTPPDFDGLFDPNVIFGPPRVLGQLRVSFPDLVRRAEPGIGVIAQHDLRFLSNPDSELFNSQYLLVRLESPVGEAFAYDLFSVLMAAQRTPSETDFELGVLAGLRTQLFGSGRGRSVFTVDAIAASGERTPLDPYVPVTPVFVGSVIPVPVAGHAGVGGALALRPFHSGIFDNLQFELSTRAIFALNAEEPSALAGTDTSGYYRGQDAGFALRFRPTSDIGIGLNIDALIPSPDAAVESVQLRGLFTASLSI